MNVLGIIASAVAALFITAVLAKGVHRTVLRSRPAPEGPGRGPRARKLRKLGGAALALGTGAAVAAAWALGPDGSAGTVGALLAGAGTVAALGLVHDLRPLPFALRLTVQAAAATLVAHLAGLSPAAALPAVLWIVLVTNAFALLDNSDGLLPAVAVVTAGGLFTCAAVDGRLVLGLFPAALAAGSVGLLLHSWHPARVHLGSTGALFTGFALASCGALIQFHAPQGRTAWAALPLLATVALADSALVLISRRRAGRPLVRGGGDHIAHRLRRLRVTVPGAAVVMVLWALVPVLAVTLVYAGTLHPAFLLAVPLASGAAVAALLRVPVYAAAPRGAAARGTASRPTAFPPAARTAPGSARPLGTATANPTVPPPTGRPSAGITADRR
ncbi:MraY family glycosyltransferase [Streptomyces sp. NPDC088729]|uniref:MraY family glycosyltransferase n=1 Tax=Streptomyces sp. NPDC088729 TaxID=3365876 RepID=UPI0037F4102B